MPAGARHWQGAGKPLASRWRAAGRRSNRPASWWNACQLLFAAARICNLQTPPQRPSGLRALLAPIRHSGGGGGITTATTTPASSTRRRRSSLLVVGECLALAVRRRAPPAQANFPQFQGRLARNLGESLTSGSCGGVLARAHSRPLHARLPAGGRRCLCRRPRGVWARVRPSGGGSGGVRAFGGGSARGGRQRVLRAERNGPARRAAHSRWCACQAQLGPGTRLSCPRDWEKNGSRLAVRAFGCSLARARQPEGRQADWLRAGPVSLRRWQLASVSVCSAVRPSAVQLRALQTVKRTVECSRVHSADCLPWVACVFPMRPLAVCESLRLGHSVQELILNSALEVRGSPFSASESMCVKPVESRHKAR